MLLIQDVHIVVGRDEVPFEDHYRETLASQVGSDPEARFVAFLWAPHGAGEGYEAVTLTALAGVDALARHQERLATGDLADPWLELEAKQRHLHSSLHRVADWCAIAGGGLDAFVIGDRPTALYRLDTFVLDEGSTDDAVGSFESQSAGPPSDSTVEIVGCWSPFLGDLDEPVVSVLSRIVSDDALRSVLARPEAPWPGVPEAPGARRVTRLLRSVAWSPLH